MIYNESNLKIVFDITIKIWQINIFEQKGL